MTWYLLRDERQVGPLSEEALRAMAATGQVGPDSLVRRAESEPWGMLAAIPDILGPGVVAQDHEIAACDTAVELAPPWPRLWARLFDVFLAASLIEFAVGIVRPSLFRPGGAFFGHEGLLGWLVIPLAMLVDAGIYAIFGNTAGKAIAGIKVVSDPDSERLLLPSYVKRNLELYLFGLGTGLPLVTLITMFLAFRKLDGGHILSWDLATDSHVIRTSRNPVRTWIVAVIYLALVTYLTLSRVSHHVRP